jgi:ABC-type branched-subunit amino acid transport system ATPase component/predicted MFS family arabinose efflux permease
VIERIRDYFSDVTRGGPVFPLFVLFGLNAVDELDRTAFGILLPEIREEFDLSLSAVLSVIALVTLAALALQVPIAAWADRSSRVRIAVGGAAVWGVFSLFTGLAPTLFWLCVFRSGSAVGRAVVDPTHNSLIADLYEPAIRPRIYSIHRAGNAVGQFVGPFAAGLLAFEFGWRVPFIVFAVPTAVFVLLGLKLKEPLRGTFERRAMGASEEAILTEEPPPSFAESWRIVWKIESLRRIWWSLPFLSASFIGFVALASLMYEQEYGLDERARGFAAAGVEPLQLVGLVIGARIGVKLFAKGPGEILRFLAWLSCLVSALLVVFALAPWLPVSIAMHGLITAALAALLPGILASLSLAIPVRARSMGFSVASLWIIPGLIALPVIGWVGDTWNIRLGMLLLVPIYLIGGLLISRAGSVIAGDIAEVWKAAAAQSEVAYERRQGRSKLLLVRGLDVHYGDVQVLFGVDLEVDEGEIVALLGTNGAGKSTLLKAISGVVEATNGAVIVDGRETTHAPPYEIAALGVLQVPGGNGVFPSLTVEENLDLAGWLHKGERAELDERRARVFELFPVLLARLSSPAADLSGGQQQMLTLGMALLSKPKLLMIDELSLGLAPVVVEQLLPVVREMRDGGTTVILVEQSVNVALTVASTAYFMEKGEIRFSGPTAELLDRPDVLRSVFLEGAGRDVNGASVRTGPAVTAPADGSPALRLRGVSRAFGGVRAVNGVDLDVAPGEIVGIIGPNGAGKTTLFDLVSGFTPLDGGSIVLGGVEIGGLPPHRRALHGLGRSFQDARLFPGLTVAETIAVALEREVEARDPISAALHLPTVFDAEEKVRARVDELLELLGLEAYRTKFVRELSTGSRRIVDLACVVAHRPTVVLLDEPSSGIAQRETEALGPLLLRIREGLGASVLVIEHDMPLVTAVSDRLVAMDQGRVIAEGPASQVLHDPVVVASYLGTTEAVIARSGGSARATID